MLLLLLPLGNRAQAATKCCNKVFPEKAWLFLPSAFLAVFLFLYIGIGINVFLFLSFCPCRLMRELQCWWGNWGGRKTDPRGWLLKMCQIEAATFRVDSTGLLLAILCRSTQKQNNNKRKRKGPFRTWQQIICCLKNFCQAKNFQVWALDTSAEWNL